MAYFQRRGADPRARRMPSLQLVFGVLLTALGAWVAFLNWTAPFASRGKGRHVSMVPLVGAVLLGAGIWLWSGSLGWALLAIPLDLGTLMLFPALFGLIREWRDHAPAACLHRLVCRAEDRCVTIDLFRNDRAVLTIDFAEPSGPDRQQPRPVQAGLMGSWSAVEGGFRVRGFAGERELLLRRDGESYLSRESQAPEEYEAHTALGGLRFVLQSSPA